MNERNDFSSLMSISKSLSEKLMVQNKEVANLKIKVIELEQTIQDKERNLELSMHEKLELMSSIYSLTDKLNKTESCNKKLQTDVVEINNQKIKFDKEIVEQCYGITAELSSLIENSCRIVSLAFTRFQEFSKSRKSFLNSIHDILLCSGLIIDENTYFDENEVLMQISKLCSQVSIIKQSIDDIKEEHEEEKKKLNDKLFAKTKTMANHVFYTKCLANQFSSAICTIDRLATEAKDTYRTDTTKLIELINKEKQKVNSLSQTTKEYNESMKENCQRVTELEQFFNIRIKELENALKEEREKNREHVRNSAIMKSLFTLAGAKTTADLIVNISNMKRRSNNFISTKQELCNTKEILNATQSLERRMSERNTIIVENNKYLKERIDELEKDIKAKEETQFVLIIQFLTQLQISSSNSQISKIAASVLSEVKKAINEESKNIEEKVSHHLIVLANSIGKLCSDDKIQILRPKSRTYASKQIMMPSLDLNPHDYD